MFIIDGKDLEDSVLFDQDPTGGSLQNLLFSLFSQYLSDRIMGLDFGCILVDLDLHVLNGILDRFHLVEKIGIDDSDFWKTVLLILFGLQRKKAKKSVEIHLVVLLKISIEEPSDFLLRGHQGWF